MEHLLHLLTHSLTLGSLPWVFWFGGYGWMHL
jgi:hypothetical protein